MAWRPITAGVTNIRGQAGTRLLVQHLLQLLNLGLVLPQHGVLRVLVDLGLVLDVFGTIGVSATHTVISSGFDWKDYVQVKII